MTEKKKAGRDAEELRRRAEEIDREHAVQTPELEAELSAEVAGVVIHELRVHQIELEIQNEELRRTQAELDISRELYMELYELAPAGYLTFSEQGLILTVNLAFSTMVGVAREALVRQPMSNFIFREDQDLFYIHRKQLLATGTPQACELRLVKPAGGQFWIRLEANLAQKSGGTVELRAMASDITARKVAEGALAESERLLKLAQIAARIGYFSLDIKTGLWQGSAELNSIHGVSASYVADLFKQSGEDVPHWAGLIVPEHRRKMIDRFDEVLQRGLRWDVEYKIVRPVDGKEVWLSAQGELDYDAAGNPSHLSGFIRDITDRKVAEETLAESEARLREVLENSLDASYKRDLRNNTYEYLSPVFARISGYTPEEMKTLPVDVVLALIHPDDMAEVERVLAESMSGDAGTASRLEYRFRHKEGHYRWFHDQFTVVRDAGGQPLARIGSVSDITKRKCAEKDLAESEAKYRIIFEMNSDAMFLIDVENGKILDTNEAGVAMYGYSRDELLQIRNIDLSAEPEETIKASKQAGSSGVIEIPLRYHRKKDGTVFPVEINATTLTHKGRLVHIPAIRDITKRKEMEIALGESEKRFRELVRDVNVILYVMNSKGEITFMNEYGLSFFGYAAEELIGKTELETILPEYESTGLHLKKISDEFRSIKQLHQRHTHENITKSKRRVWVDWTRRLIAAAETGDAGWICAGVDVTAVKRAEQERLRLFTRRRIRETLNETINRRFSQIEMIGELRQTGIELEAPFVLTLLSIPSEYLPEFASDKDRMERQHQIDLLIDFVHGSKTGIACQTPAGVVIILSVSPARSRPLSIANAKLAVKELLKKMSGYWVTRESKVGVSHSTEAVQDVATLYEQAGAALQYGPTLSPGRVVYHWQDLGCYQFIVKDLQSEAVQQFIQVHLGPIINEKNAKNRAEDWATLQALVSGDSFQVIADRCGVHKNTIAYRKKKLEDILGVELDEAETKVDLAIAMKLLSFLS